jgi:hypothetical protein
MRTDIYYNLSAGTVRQKIVEDSSTLTTYVCTAPCGTTEAEGKWQIKRIVEATVGTVTTTQITWADGNDAFDNVATDPTALSYS